MRLTGAQQQLLIEPRECRSCGEPVWDLRNVNTGKLAPIEVISGEGGNITVDLEAGTYNVVGQRVGFPRHVNHFMRCPQAASWRRRG